MMLFGWLRTILLPKSSAQVDEPEPSPLGADEDPFDEPVMIGTGDTIDLHTIPPSQSRQVVEEFLLEAHHRGYRYLRIVHGKGIGVQRRMVREVLARTPFVISFEDAPPAAGGLGATLVVIAGQESIGDSNCCQVE